MSETWKGKALNKWVSSQTYQKNWENIFRKNKESDTKSVLLKDKKE